MTRQLFTLTLLALFLTGCAGYSVGGKSLFSRDVATVYVPIVESDSYRRGLAERLTEAIIKRIESKSIYKVVQRPAAADSTLRCRLISDRQGLSLVNDYDDPRQKTETMTVEVSWTDRRDREMNHLAGDIEWNTATGKVQAETFLVPEMGSSQATAEHEAINRLADQIVGMMETPW
ncbi:MAG: LPS assembly lipoprotein LptE [Thermoguttaceae bacterium]